MILTNMNNKIISIHAPRTGSDQTALKTGADPVIFQSTLPARGATDGKDYIDADTIISIHAPRTGSDVIKPETYLYNLVFQSTLPARGATFYNVCYSSIIRFQSTLPARGATSLEANDQRWDHPFQSTLPARGATGRAGNITPEQLISIHAPRTVSDSRFAFLIFPS